MNNLISVIKLFLKVLDILIQQNHTLIFPILQIALLILINLTLTRQTAIIQPASPDDTIHSVTPTPNNLL